jgi:murein DD-endopeptidase MepM/ murein hydrolase activator NlpD
MVRTRLLPCPALRILILLAVLAPGILVPSPAETAAARAGAGAPAPDPVGTWPLDPEPVVVSGFDPPELVWGAGHRGVDLLGSPAQVVRAALPGQVTFAGSIGGKRVVVVDHGPTRTTYEPVAASVRPGDVVGGGDRLGWLLVPFSHCYPAACLHWGWRRRKTYLDPLRLVDEDAAVRLLPLWSDLPVGPQARGWAWR